METKTNALALSNSGEQKGRQKTREEVQTLEQFNKMLNEEPPTTEVETNVAAGGSKYLPISVVQMLLDKIFMGIWETENFRYTVVANEEVGSITLKYFHPILNIWIKREGSAAVMIMQKSKDQNGNPTLVTDISAKIKNTMAKDHPHLMASCMMSAARTIGKRFGRDLNRKIEDKYTTFYTDIADAEEGIAAINWAEVTDLAKLTAVWKNNPDLQSNQNFIKHFTYQKNKLTN